ncbi:hypothetical protein OS493_034075 [Desmophyllum pertusum]|uniref:Uncharacterized protein n=1 Tax=Desmophyllum pertusum TaxID=174260 RepID=A0A9W9YVJ5_9CNID|nr:hypothetical protein OS493_034075 [Desmophyllum pertusum]
MSFNLRCISLVQKPTKTLSDPSFSVTYFVIYLKTIILQGVTTEKMNKCFVAVVAVFLLISLITDDSDAGGRRRRYRARGLQSNAQGMKINEAPLVKRDINQAHFGDEEELDFVNEE